MDGTHRQEALEVIAAFADGERVDSRALRAALADEAGRDYLIDIVAMREIARASEEGAMTPAASRSIRSRGAWSALAAGLVVTVGLAGYAIGHRNSPVERVAVRPPLEADVVVSAEVPPEPTQVIHLGNASPSRGR